MQHVILIGDLKYFNTAYIGKENFKIEQHIVPDASRLISGQKQHSHLRRKHVYIWSTV